MSATARRPVPGQAITKRPAPEWNRPSDRETTAIAAKLPSWALPQIPEAAKLCIIAARPDYRSANIRAPCHQIDDGVRVKASQRVSNVLLRLLVCSFGEGKTGGPKTPHPRHVTLGFEERRFAHSPLEGDGFELVWGFSCQVVVFDLSSLLCSERERAFFVPSPAIRFPGRAEGVKGPKR